MPKITPAIELRREVLRLITNRPQSPERLSTITELSPNVIRKATSWLHVHGDIKLHNGEWLTAQLYNSRYSRAKMKAA